jgi:hypothetical protein
MKKILQTLFISFVCMNAFSQGFTFTVTPTVQTVGRNGTISFNVNVTPFGGYSASIFFSVSTSNCINSYMSVQSPTLNAPYTGETVVYTGDNTADLGYYQIIVTGQNGAYSFSDTCYLDVVPSSNNAWTIYDETNSGFTNPVVHKVEFDTQSNIWSVARNGYGPPVGCLTKYDGTKWEVWTLNNHYFVDNCNNVTAINTNSPVGNEGVLTFALDEAHNCVWIGNSSGQIHKLNRTTGAWTSYAWSIPSVVCDLATDSQGNLWIASWAGVYYFNGTSLINYNSSNSPIPNGTVAAHLLVDTNDDMWCTTGNGVIKFDGAFWTIYNASTSIVPNSVNGIYQDHTGDIWVGASQSIGQDIFRYSGGNWTTVYTPTYFAVTDFVRIFDKLYFGTGADGLYEYNLVTTNFVNYTISNSQLPPDHYMNSYHNMIFTLAKRPSDNALAIGTFGGGLVIARGGALVGLNETKSPPAINTFFDLYPNPSNGSFTLSVKNTETGPVTIKVLNMLGQTVLEKHVDLSAGKNELSLEIPQKGMYLVSLQTSDGSVNTQKIIIE